MPLQSVITLSPNRLLCISGMGEQRAEASARKLVAAGATALVSWGTCAGLVSEVTYGNLIIGTAVGQFICCEHLKNTFVKTFANLPVTCGRVAHSQELLQTVSAKAALAQTTNAVVADMESAAIARYATELGVPFGAIRVVSDAVDTALPSYLSRTQTKEGFIDTRKLLALALVHPHEWSVFYQMARGGIAAQKTLQRAASLLVEV